MRRLQYDVALITTLSILSYLQNMASLWLQNNSFSNVMKWQRERRKLGLPASGWLEATGNRAPTPAEWRLAFPSQEVDYHALQNPPRAA